MPADVDDGELEDFLSFLNQPRQAPPLPILAECSTEDPLEAYLAAPIESLAENVVPTEPLPLVGEPFTLLEGVQEVALRLARELLQTGPFSFHDLEPFDGDGIYAIYYQGDLLIYASIRSLGSSCPLYLGKSARRTTDRSISERLRLHSVSLQQAGLGLENFTFRFVRLPSELVEFAEYNLLSLYRPLWNDALKGFGSNPGHEGTSRKYHRVSAWDTFHPGRATEARILSRDRDSIKDRVQRSLPECRMAYERVMTLLGQEN